MAKMFYSMEEAAEKLGVDVDKVRKMTEDGKLQQYRDRDRIMFKVDQVDKLAASSAAEESDESEESGELTLADTGGDTDAIDLASETDTDHGGGGKNKGQSGVSVFETDEIDAADPAAQTVVSGPAKTGKDEEAEQGGEDEEDELATESVGSGSGLLDLTRESDDTSLGAELLEEIYPAGGSDEKMEGTGVQTGQFEGIFDAGAAETGAATGVAEAEAEAGEPVPATVVAADAVDPVSSGWTSGLLVGALACLLIALLAVLGAMGGVTTGLVAAIAGNLWLWLGVLGGGTLVLGIIGYAVGRALS